jgi:hypothetical protein
MVNGPHNTVRIWSAASREAGLDLYGGNSLSLDPAEWLKSGAAQHACGKALLERINRS